MEKPKSVFEIQGLALVWWYRLLAESLPDANNHLTSSKSTNEHNQNGLFSN